MLTITWEIRPAMEPPVQGAGIYLWIQKGCITYVGQSAEMAKRHFEHMSNLQGGLEWCWSESMSITPYEAMRKYTNPLAVLDDFTTIPLRIMCESKQEIDKHYADYYLNRLRLTRSNTSRIWNTLDKLRIAFGRVDDDEENIADAGRTKNREHCEGYINIRASEVLGLQLKIPYSKCLGKISKTPPPVLPMPINGGDIEVGEFIRRIWTAAPNAFKDEVVTFKSS